LRASDPTALRVARSSVPTFDSVLPESGVRPAPSGELGHAPTIDAKASGASDAAELASTHSPADLPRTQRTPSWRVLIAAGAILALIAVIALGLRGEPEAKAQVSSAPEARPSAGLPATTPAAVPPPPAPPVVEIATSPAPLVAPRPVERQVRSVPASSKRAAEGRARPGASGSGPSAPSDLLSPY